MSLQLEGEALAMFPMNLTSGRDSKAWAKRILYRLERGDKTLLAVQIKFAQMAMGIEEGKAP